MKIKSFLLILFFSIISKFHISYADEAKMKKGLEIFNETAGCAACHVLKAAESSGEIGPNLDQLKPPLNQIIYVVTNGIGVMQSWEGILTKEEIEAVAYYVFKSTNE